MKPLLAANAALGAMFASEAAHARHSSCVSFDPVKGEISVRMRTGCHLLRRTGRLRWEQVALEKPVPLKPLRKGSKAGQWSSEPCS